MWNETIECKKGNVKCPYKPYFAVASNKLVHGVNLKTNFQDFYPSLTSSFKIKDLEDVNDAVSKMAMSPGNYVPGMSSECNLMCHVVDSGQEITIFSVDNEPQVIQSLLFRVYDKKEGLYTISNHWERILVTMTWDERKSQVNDIPLAGFFAAGIGYIRQVNGLMAGIHKKKCTSNGKGHSSEFEVLDWVGYLYYEMPFWKSARIVIKRPQGFGSAVVCTQINTKKMNIRSYNPRLTGYFSVQLNRYDFNNLNLKRILHVDNEWGHVVAINMIGNFPPAGEELDIIIETDNAIAPVISGTGLEDYFGYVHHFFGMSNSSSVLNGAPCYIRRNRVSPLPKQVVNTYRQMVFDPILFTKGAIIYLEGRSGRSKFRRTFDTITSVFNQTMFKTTIFSTVIFYGSKGTGGITTDNLDLGSSKSTSSHNVRYLPNEVDMFTIVSAFENQPVLIYNRTIVSLKVKQRITQTFTIRKDNVGVTLRRIYRTVVPNQKAKVVVDGKDAGVWFCPQRAYSNDFSLRIDDYPLHPRLTVGKRVIEVTFEALTLWESSSIEVISLILLP